MRTLARHNLFLVLSFVMMLASCGTDNQILRPSTDSAPVALPPSVLPASAPLSGGCVTVRDCANDALASAQAAQRAAEQATAQLRASMVGAVVAFNAKTCPKGWSEYAPAQGRFVRGIDKPGGNIDPDGVREPGSLQDQMLQAHHHDVPRMPVDSYPQGDSGKGDHLGAFKTGQTNDTGGAETRPKNVALLYCILQ